MDQIRQFSEKADPDPQSTAGFDLFLSPTYRVAFGAVKKAGLMHMQDASTLVSGGVQGSKGKTEQ